MPDPQDEATVRASTLDWTELDLDRHAGLLAWTRDLIALRRARPELSDGHRDRTSVSYDEDERWLVVRRGRVAVVANLADVRRSVPVAGSPQAVLLTSERGFTYADGRVELAPESVAIVELA